MDEVLKKLLSSELLSEETRAEISEQWTKSVEAFRQQLREEETLKLRAEFSQQWINERDELINKVDAFVAEALNNELTELKSDIEQYRDLQAEMAQRLVEEKHRLAEEVAKELDQLVDKLDAFLEMQLTAELTELKEDLELVKQNQFGKQIFEAFVNTYAKHYVDESSVQAQLALAESKLQDVQRQLSVVEADRNKMLREAEMERVLAPLTGPKREQMAMILKPVETAKLQESYNHFIGRILREDTSAIKPGVLTESVKQTTVVTGEPATTTAATGKSKADAETLRLAGLGR
jgi:DNA repair exonuclease SbcCD ATPase subunit